MLASRQLYALKGGSKVSGFFEGWAEAAFTSIGFFWMAFWAFGLGYLISSLIQVLVTKERMQSAMGTAGPRSVALGTFFGFISSSCSFAALSTTRSLFQKGAGLVPSLAFMLASTNLVIELGFVIAIFLSWQFVVAEYVGGILLILFAWLFVKITNPKKLVERAREKLGDKEDEGKSSQSDWKEKIRSWAGWESIGMKYQMEWMMVWRDVLIGFTVAGIISAFVPDAFFKTLFPGAGSQDLSFFEVLGQTLVGPVAAFFTVIGSMGNIPLAALLFGQGVSFAGVIAFIFSDLVVFPVLRINAQYYGWKMALYLLLLMLVCLVSASILMHYGFSLFSSLPDQSSGSSITDRDMFKVNYGFYLNILFLIASGVLLWLARRKKRHQSEGHSHDHGGGQSSITDKVLKVFSVAAILWLAGGLILKTIL